MKKKKKLGIISLISVIVLLFSAMPASAAGPAMVQLLLDVSPKGSVSVRVGQSMTLRALAASDSQVTAEIYGQTVKLTATSEAEDGALWHEGTYTVPHAVEGTSLGAIRFTAVKGGRSESRMGGTLTIAEKNITLEVTPPADTSVEPVAGDMIMVNADYADIFSPNPRADEYYASPYLYNLPGGTIDYVESAVSSSYILKSGRRIAKSNVTSLGSGTQGNNVIYNLVADTDGTFTTLTIDQTWNVPFNLTPAPLAYASSNSNTVVNCVPDAVILTFDYTTSFRPTRLTFPEDSAFIGASWRQMTVDGIPKLQLTLELAHTGGYYGAYAEYNSSGELVLTFLNPVDSLEGARIVVDPGHGTSDPGNTGSGYYESVLNLQKAQALRDELEARGAEVYMLDSNGAKALDLYERVDLAIAWMPHVYVSVHHNWASSTSARGVEVFYNNPYSQRLAKYINDEIFAAYQTMAYGSNAKSRGGKFSEFAVTRTHQFAAVLVEYGFLSNAEELSICVDQKNNPAFAKATADGIEAFFGG